MNNVILELFAITQSNRFTAYTQGISVKLPTGKVMFVKVRKTCRSIRPIGFRFSNFAFVTEVTADHHLGIGFGEASTRLVALQKSIAEGVERALYRSLKETPFGSPNSNGWAAHISLEKALSASLEELLERDAVLVHWLCRKPMAEILPQSWPRWLVRWTENELRLSPRFNQLRILYSSLGHLPTTSTVLLSNDGHAVLSHATAAKLEEGVSKALAEACRLAHIVSEGSTECPLPRFATANETGLSVHPENHAFFYAETEKFPTWIFGDPTDWSEAESTWKARRRIFDRSSVNPKFHSVASGPLTVGYCTSDLIQNLFFGRTDEAQLNGLVNLDRLTGVKHEGDLNYMPHCVA